MSLTQGELVDANPENWLIRAGKLYIFGKTVGPALFDQDLTPASLRPPLPLRFT